MADTLPKLAISDQAPLHTTELRDHPVFMAAEPIAGEQDQHGNPRFVSKSPEIAAK